MDGLGLLTILKHGYIILERGMTYMDIVHPPMSVLLQKVDSRYTLVVLAAKRDRQLLDGAEVKVSTQTTKNVTKALAEVAEERIRYERRKVGIK